MPTTVSSAAIQLRVSDLVPLRRMLGRDSVVIRINPNGSFVPRTSMPTLFFERSIRQVLTDDGDTAFEDACATATAHGSPVTFCPDATRADQVMIYPILDDYRDEYRFLVCWARKANSSTAPTGSPAWGELCLDQVATRYRLRTDHHSVVVEAAPWWALTSGEPLSLWSHHSHVSAMGLGHAVMESLIMHAAEAAAEFGGGPAVRIEVPSAEMMSGLVPVFHGAVRASGLSAERVIVAVDVHLAADPDLLPVIVHLRTMGMQIDIVGLDAFTAALHTVSATSNYHHPLVPGPGAQLGPWVDSFANAHTTCAA